MRIKYLGSTVLLAIAALSWSAFGDEFVTATVNVNGVAFHTQTIPHVGTWLAPDTLCDALNVAGGSDEWRGQFGLLIDSQSKYYQWPGDVLEKEFATRQIRQGVKSHCHQAPPDTVATATAFVLRTHRYLPGQPQ